MKLGEKNSGGFVYRGDADASGEIDLIDRSVIGAEVKF